MKLKLIEIRLSGGLNVDFSLWVMFIAASVVEGPDTKDYFLASATEIIETLDFSCWDNAENLFKSFFWVEKIHRGTFKPIWSALDIDWSKGGCFA